MISEEQKLIFIHINKTAGSSIEIAFNQQQPDKQHQTLRCYAKDRKIKEYFTFTFVRNPWDRIVSWYLWLHRQNFWYDGMPTFDGMTSIPEKGVNFGGHPSVQEKWYLALKGGFKPFLKKIKSTKDIKQYLGKSSNLSLDNYYKGRWVASQREWIRNNSGKINIDFIGRFENLQNDFDELCDKLGKDRRPLMEAKKLNKRPHYSKFYDDESIEIIKRLYKDDIKHFDYKYEETKLQSL